MMDADFPLTQLDLWFDAPERDGPENMAVDEWLMETVRRPLLRVYCWRPGWGSLGCFGNHDEAEASIPGVQWVRRYTGGGIVDHRDDWTYTLAVPPSESLATRRGAESYELIHRALSKALERTALSDEQVSAPAGLCFQNPVRYDLISPSGEKIAGAGQRRNRYGLLHQGSVAGRIGREDSRRRSLRFSEALCGDWQSVELEPSGDVLAEKISRRYGDARWLRRRC